MRLTVTLTYPAAPSAVGRMLLDEEFHRRVCAATGDPAARVKVEVGAGSALVETARTLPTDRLPEAMRVLVGRHVTVVQTVSWPVDLDDSGWSGTVVVVVDGMPVRLDATALARPAGAGGTTITYDGDLVARVPLLGARVEKGAEPVVRSAMEAEQRVGLAWLAETSA